MTLEETWELCNDNFESVRASKFVGCFYCLAIYTATAVDEFVWDGTVAVCPLCSVDSILPDSKVTLTPELLENLHAKYFTAPSTSPLGSAFGEGPVTSL